MGKYFLVMFFFLGVSIHGQIKGGIVKYGITVSENKESELEKLLLSLNGDFYSIASEIDFDLRFNRDKSMFKLEEKMYSNDRAAEICKVKAGYFGTILCVNDSLYRESSSKVIGDYILKQEVRKVWVLHTETKLIDGYLCYKATTEDVVVNTDKTWRHPITAWYCPKIPFPFGPLGYGGLPGLILELQTKDCVYGAKKIDLGTSDVAIKALKKYKVVTEIELNELIENKNR